MNDEDKIYMFNGDVWTTESIVRLIFDLYKGNFKEGENRITYLMEGGEARNIIEGIAQIGFRTFSYINDGVYNRFIHRANGDFLDILALPLHLTRLEPTSSTGQIEFRYNLTPYGARTFYKDPLFNGFFINKTYTKTVTVSAGQTYDMVNSGLVTQSNGVYTWTWGDNNTALPHIINWGDETDTYYNDYDPSVSTKHQYTKAGTYTITISTYHTTDTIMNSYKKSHSNQTPSSNGVYCFLENPEGKNIVVFNSYTAEFETHKFHDIKIKNGGDGFDVLNNGSICTNTPKSDEEEILEYKTSVDYKDITFVLSPTHVIEKMEIDNDGVTQIIPESIPGYFVPQNNYFSIKVPAESVGTGSVFNVAPGVIDSFDPDDFDVEALGYLSATNPLSFRGGSDFESDDDFRDRLLQNNEACAFGSPSWYKSVTLKMNGVQDAYVINRPEGDYTGTIVISPETSDPELAETIRQDVYDYFQNPCNNLLGIQVNVLIAQTQYIDNNVSIYYVVNSESNPVEVRDAVQKVVDLYLQNFTIGQELTGLKLEELFSIITGAGFIRATVTTNAGIVELSPLSENKVSLGERGVLKFNLDKVDYIQI